MIVIHKKDGKDFLDIGSIELSVFDVEMVSIVKKNPDMLKLNAYWLLDGHQYQILNIEKTDALKKSEMQNFIKWKMKEYIDVPTDDLVVDIIFNDHKAHPFFAKNVTVVAAYKQYIDKIVALKRRFKLKISVIDVPELAVRDFFDGVTNIDSNVVFAYFRLFPTYTMFNIYIGNSLCLTRKIEKGFDVDSYEYFYEKMVLEIQRSVDFLDRQHSISQFKSFFVDSENIPVSKKFADNISHDFSVINIEVKKEKNFVRSVLLSPEVCGVTLRGVE
jgi:hypothetical protein